MTSLQRRAVLAGSDPRPWPSDCPPAARARAQSALSAPRRRRDLPGTALCQPGSTRSRQANPDLAFAYDAVGSGEGVRRLIAGSVDFAASDAAMTDEQIAKVPAGVRLIPATAGLVVDRLQSPGTHRAAQAAARCLLRRFFAGEITELGRSRGSRRPIRASTCRTRTIAVVARLDSSGTTFALTNNLSAVSEAWRRERGAAHADRLARQCDADARQ